MRVYCGEQLHSNWVDKYPWELRESIERGNYNVVKRSIKNNRHLVHRPSGSAANFPVHVAAQAGHRRIVKLLLLYGANPNARNALQRTPAHLCMLYCRYRVAELLFDRGADPTAVDDHNRTPLELATMLNKRRCVDVLLNRCHIPVDVVNNAFYNAVLQENTILMNKLLNRGADIEFKKEMTGGLTVLLVAMKLNMLRATQFLLEKGANPMIYDQSRMWTCLHYAVYFKHPISILSSILKASSREYLDYTTSKQETALHLAAKTGNNEAALALIKAGANVDAINYRFYTPLMTALRWKNYMMCKIVVEAGANVNVQTINESDLPLHIAVAHDDLQLVQLMLQHGAVVVDQHKDLNWSLIHAVCDSGNVKMLSSMLSCVEPKVLNAMHEGGRVFPPLLVASMKGDVQAVDVLLAHGVDVNVRCERGETALHMAIQSNNASLVEQLLDRGACIDTHDVTIGCCRPLDMAVHLFGRERLVTMHLINSNRFVKAVVRHDLTLVKFLLASGVSPNVNTMMYGTPLHMAVQNKQYCMISTIMSSDLCRTDLQFKGATPLDYAIAMGDARATRIMMWRDDEKRRQRTRHLSLSFVERRKQLVLVKPPPAI